VCYFKRNRFVMAQSEVTDKVSCLLNPLDLRVSTTTKQCSVCDQNLILIGVQDQDSGGPIPAEFFSSFHFTGFFAILLLFLLVFFRPNACRSCFTETMALFSSP